MNTFSQIAGAPASNARLAAASATSAAPPPTVLAGFESMSINILIVDDEPANLVVLETVLDDPGYRLIRAASGAQALLALMEEEEFAVLILDVRLPDMTGFELASVIKDRKKTSTVPIIFLTAYYDKDSHALEGYGSGAVDYLNKPVSPAVLRSKVAVFADLHRKNRAIAQANVALMGEVLERRRAEEQLRDLNETLEQRVIERTEALRQADRKLQIIMNSITDGLLMLDQERRLTYCNEQGATLLGKRVDDLLGRPARDLFPSTVAETFEASCRRAMLSRQAVSFELFYPKPVSRWLEFRAYPSDQSLSVYFHDVTDRREVETRREHLLSAEHAARTEGERVARAKDHFLASLGHELRTPLAAILGWSSVLQRSNFDPAMLQRGIDAIASSARAQTRLVNDLLDVSRIVSGKLRMSFGRLALCEVARSAVDAVRPVAQDKGVTLELNLADEQSTDIVGDRLRLQQIASNLLINALKFTPAGGKVTVTTAAQDGHAELVVVDSGVGISPEFVPHLFERFSQADSADARDHGGLGLGLSIVKNLAELHAGSVTAWSDGKGRGASFRVRLPLADSAAAQGLLSRMLPFDEDLDEGEAREPCATQLELDGVEILLVDDHLELLDLQRRMLVDCGAIVTTASSADQALECLHRGSFDVLLTDLGMPGSDGFALIHSVRTQLGLSAAQLPAAAITAFSRPEDRDRALDNGFQAYLFKPASPSALTLTVRRLLQSANDSNPQPQHKPLAAPLPAARGPVRTLLVEDNEYVREQLTWLLEEEGLDVVACASGEAAETAFTARTFDLVVTDVSLPGMSGVELARRILSRSPRCWLVFHSGHPMEDRLHQFGPRVRALMKPFEVDDLRRLLDEVQASFDPMP